AQHEGPAHHGPRLGHLRWRRGARDHEEFPAAGALHLLAGELVLRLEALAALTTEWNRHDCFSTANSPRVTNRGLQPVLTLSAARENWQDFSARSRCAGQASAT